GRLFPPFCGNPVISFARYAATSFFDQLNSVPSIHMRCRMTASLRATATLALRSPFRLASLIPQAFSADHFGTRVSSTLAASNRYVPSTRRTGLEEPNDRHRRLLRACREWPRGRRAAD